jgi:non-specific serine/threonine protein kinase
LIVLDNCEHLISACAQFVESILQKCPTLKILATSREVLGIIGEVAWTVPPLSLPGQYPWVNTTSSADALRLYQESESVQLFVARAQATAPGFELTVENGSWIAEICRRLDGMPLALELAAARVRSLSVQQIAQRLDDRFNLLTGGSRTAPPRQRTLLATLDWSYALLSDLEQKVLQRLSVFAGGATLDAIESLCVDNGIESVEILNTLFHLIDKSLVSAEKSQGAELEPRGEEFPRYRLLETIRQYALEKLTESGNMHETRNQHLDYFIRWAENAEPYLASADQLLWLELYEAEHDNLRAALDWCNMSNQGEKGLRLAAACGRFWRLRGYSNEGRRRFSAALARLDAQSRTMTRARALTFMANLIYLQSDYPAMHPVAEEALSIWRELGDDGKAGLATMLDLLGELATEEGNYEFAAVYFLESLNVYQALNDRRGIADIHMQLGWAAMRTGAYEEAEMHLHEFLNLARQVGDKTLIAFAFSGLGELAIRQGKFDIANSLLDQGLALNRERGDKWGTGTLLGSLGWVAFHQSDIRRMRHFLGESLMVRKEISDKGGMAWCLEKLAEAKYMQSQFEEAARIFGFAEELRAPIRSVIDPADQPAYKRLVSDLGGVLGHDEFAALWLEGKTMELDDAIDLALSETRADSNLTEKESSVA